MNQEFKEKWVAALRSGKYQQCREVLHDGLGYCCLGVACEVAGIKPRYDGSVYTYDSHEAMMPPALVKAIELPRVQGHLAGFNDNGLSFDQIADWIEVNL